MLDAYRAISDARQVWYDHEVDTLFYLIKNDLPKEEAKGVAQH